MRSPRRVRQRAVMGGEFGIRLVDFRVVEVGLVHGRAQVVRHQPARDTAEEAEGFDMRLGPGVLVHVQQGSDEHVPRAGQHHHKRPDPVPFPGPRIDPPTHEPVVDLGFGARLHVVPQHGDLRLDRLIRQVFVHPAAEGRQRCLQLVLVTEPLVDRGDRGRRQQALDVVTVLVDLLPGQLVQPPRGELRKPVLDQLGPVPLAHRGPTRGDPSVFCRPQVLPDRLAVQPQRGPDLALRPARVSVDVGLDDVDHGERSPCHPVCPSTSRPVDRGHERLRSGQDPQPDTGIPMGNQAKSGQGIA